MTSCNHSIAGRQNMSKIPFTTNCTANTINITWEGERGQFNNYIVKYRAKDSKDGFAVQRTLESQIHMLNLKNETLYEIKIVLEDTNGDESSLFKTEVRTEASIASKLLKSAEKCQDPALYRLCPVNIIDNTEGIQIREFFSDVRNKEERSLLLLGASGSGKSTLVDAVINYVTDVSYGDNFRFKITDEIAQRKEDIICYKIRCQAGFKVGYNINIIDVPGFESGDNDGIYQKLLVLFQSKQYIGHVGAICLVVRSFCRLTEESRGIFSNILSILGKDVCLIPLITFDDGGELKALSTLKAAKVLNMVQLHFSFNNSQLYSGKEHVEIWNRRQITMHNLFGEPTLFVDLPVEKTRELLKSRIMDKQSFQDTKTKSVQSKPDKNKPRTSGASGGKAATDDSHIGKICINCRKCKKTCVFDCSLSVRFFWYVFVLLEMVWSLFCCSCSCCRCCSRSRCVCKRPYCYCIRCLHKCLGCTCSCSFVHHFKEYGSYCTNERDSLKTALSNS